MLLKLLLQVFRCYTSQVEYILLTHFYLDKKYLKDNYGLNFSLKEIEQGLLSIIEGFYRNEVKLKPGVKNFLESMKQKNIPMVIATSGDRDLLNSALIRNGISGYFDAVFTCSELETSKHEAKIFMACSEALGLDPENIAVFDDALYAIETAKNAGFITFGVEDPSAKLNKNEIKRISDYYITDFTLQEAYKL